MNIRIVIVGGALSSSCFFYSCNNGEIGEQHQNKNDSTHQHQHQHHQHGDANTYMNESEFQELVQRFENPEREEWQKPEKVLAFIGDLKGKTIIDIGAGTGYFVFRLSDEAEKIIAADADERFIEYIDDKNKKHRKKNLITRKAEYESAPVSENEADVVMMVNVYHHIENRVAYFKKVLTGLKNGGVLIVVDFKKRALPVGPPPEMKLHADDVIEELKSAGFRSFAKDTSELAYQYMIRAGK